MTLTLEIYVKGVIAILDGEEIRGLTRIDPIDAEIIYKDRQKVTFRGDFEVVEENGESVLKVRRE